MRTTSPLGGSIDIGIASVTGQMSGMYSCSPVFDISKVRDDADQAFPAVVGNR
jgi:hypothetical protein